VEEKTPLDLQIRKGLKPEADEEQAARQFRILLQEARKNDFIHYEISNFARKGFYSKHNSLYWLGGNYLGLGPSAHSYNGISRQWNVSSLSGYIGQPGNGRTRYEKEMLTPLQRHNEYVMTSLRTIWGCDTHHITNVFGRQAAEKFIRKASRFLQKGWMIEEQGIFFLSDEGKFYADGITAELFLDERSTLNG
jgi:oxygen-independent coproporphyrinogen-3 oxidase